MNIHALFDLAASLSAMGLTFAVYDWRLRDRVEQTVARVGPVYFVVLVAGAALGGYGLGTLNLHLTGIGGVGRSILGALFGATLAIEVYKAIAGIRGSTGVIFVTAFCTSVAVGRLGCFFSGLADNTHGTATTVPWAHDFGDGVPRHPVQLYESATMAAFLLLFLIGLGRRWPFVQAHAFYLMVAVYAGQRFLWEFLKPYGTVLGPLNLFHLVCAALFVYAVTMMVRSRDVRP